MKQFFSFKPLESAAVKMATFAAVLLLYRAELCGRMVSREADFFQRRLRPTTHSLTTSFHCQLSPAS